MLARAEDFINDAPPFTSAPGTPGFRELNRAVSGVALPLLAGHTARALSGTTRLLFPAGHKILPQLAPHRRPNVSRALACLAERARGPVHRWDGPIDAASPYAGRRVGDGEAKSKL